MRTIVRALTINFIAGAEYLTELEDFNCNRCKGKLFSTTHDYKVIWLGPGYPPQGVPKGMGWQELKCRTCPTMYNFYHQ